MDDMDVENMGVGLAERLKVAQRPSKGSAAPLQSATAHNVNNNKTIEEIYQKKTQLEHILLRPDTYIGSTEKQQQPMWVHDGERITLKPISYVPGLYKIFDEILVNAADNKARDPTMDCVKVQIDVAQNLIVVWNNGNGIPVEMHKEEGVYVPELIFGHLLTSSNYDDAEKKVTGGRNGYGAKLANIFSTEFTIETADGSRLKKYKQVFSKNMSAKTAPKITACKAGENWTSITFRPDLVKFGMTELEEDTVALMRKRVYDLAGILGKGVKVELNGQRLAIKNFQDYVDLYLGPKDTGAPRVYEKVNDRWEICISPTDGQFQQVSFVNSICTYKGGTHVNYIVDQVTKALCEKANKKNKNANVKPFMVKNHLWVFVNTLIENPAFDSQTKENLTLKVSAFGSKCELSVQLTDKVAKAGVLDAILQFANFKNNKELKKGDGTKRQRLVGIPKLDDANDAGGRNSHMCTLILTEGDSAKTLAISGLSVVGRDHYGVFPLRGKLLNVRDASSTQITGNAEINNIKQILGLQHGKNYEDVKQLRYGSVMIMTDQDHDGSHIKGLIMNFLHTFYPSLLRIPNFLVEFITPIVKATKGNRNMTFYTMPEYENWKESVGNNAKGWKIKYYKGLGTSTAKEAKEYFANIREHRKVFIYEGEEDDKAIDMAFSKKKVEERKAWLSAFQPGTFLDNSVADISYTEFINKELILFSRADVERSIPSMVDGLKPGQRKILFACFKRNLKGDIKVAQLSGYIAEHSAYHHGETSLQGTIVGLAQDFVGSNNINLLVPSGQFGTRLQGGKDSASPRYIYTRLAALTRHLFNESDDRLLNYLNEEGQNIEPEWYIPILPLVLINGAEGIGTGWSTFVPNYNPREVVANLKRLMAGQAQQPMMPWYRGFKGIIEECSGKTAGKSYNCSGIVSQVDDVSLEITELPVRKWTQDYKEYLEGLIKPEEKDVQPSLVDYKEHHTDVTVNFRLELSPPKMVEAVQSGLITKFKLSTKLSTGNMMLFNKDGLIQRYETPEHIIADFYALRLEYYEKRRVNLIKVAEAEMLRLDNRVRFILAVINGQLVVSNRRRTDIEADLDRLKFDRLLPNAKAKAALATPDEDAEEEEAVAAAGANYEYLLSMPIASLTKEKVEQMRNEAELQAAAVERLHTTTAKTMWSEDLDNFLQAYEQWEVERDVEEQQLARQQLQAAKGRGKGPAKAKPAARKKKAAGSSDDDDAIEDSGDDDDGDDWMEEAPKPKKAPARKAPAKAAAAPAPAALAAAPPSYMQPTAASRAAAKASPSPDSGSKSMSFAPARAAPQPSSSQDSLSGRLAKLSFKAPAASKARAAAATSKSAATIPEDDVMNLADSDGDLDICSPAPALAKGRGKAAAKPAAAKAPVAAKASKAKAEEAAGAKKQTKRKPRAVIETSSEEDDEEDDKDDDDVPPSPDVFRMEEPSPAVAPKGKLRKVGPSPLPQRLVSKTAAMAAVANKKPAAAPKAAAAPVPAAEPAAAAARPQRDRRAPAKTYIEISDDDEEQADHTDSEGSEYVASD